MADKTINGAYPAGYYLDPQFQSLNIGSSASVGGAGVTTTASHSSTITNSGQVNGSQNGVTLNDGGSVTNNPGAVLQGVTAVYAHGAYAAVYDGGEIKSTATTSGYTTSEHTSIVLTGGGKVSTTSTSATISNGISISGGTGTIVNRATIGAPGYRYARDGYNDVHVDASIVLANGGTVLNGSASNKTATITAGISVSGAAAIVTNAGTIGGGYNYYDSALQHLRTTYFSINSSAGLTLTNGTVTNTTALISHGVSVTGGTANIRNYGKISQTRWQIYGVFIGSGTITNGSASDTSATISGRIAVGLGTSATLKNFGRIVANQTSSAVVLAHNATLEEEGSGTISGHVRGSGKSNLVFGGDAGAGTTSGIGTDLTGFSTISIASGAKWTFTGTEYVKAGVSLTDSGSLTINGTLNNGGTCTILGTLSIGANARLTDSAGSHLLLGNTAVVDGPGRIGNAGTIIKSVGGATATISSNIANTGSIQVAQGKLDITGAITGTGSLTIGAGRTLELGGSVASGQTVAFDALTLLGNHDATLFHTVSDGAGGTAITYGSAAMRAAAPATTNDAFAQALFDAAFAPAAHIETPANPQAASSSVITASAISSPHAAQS